MTDFILKKFIKNDEDISKEELRLRYGVVSSVVGVFTNILLTIIKIIVGLVSGSIAIVIDAFNNLSDSIASLISLLSFKISNKKADKEHPFGHGRAEHLATLIVAFFIVILGWEFLQSSIEKIKNPTELNVSISIFIILVVTILVKLWLGHFFKVCGENISSKVLLATAKDANNDVIVTICTIASLLLFYFFDLNIDGYIGLLLSCLLFKTAFDISSDIMSIMLGTAPDKELAESLISKISSYDGVYGVHDLIIHTYGANQALATIHVEVSDEENINVSHELMDKIEKDINDEYNILLTIHMDPVAINDPEIKKITEHVREYLKAIDMNVDAHDFRIVKGDNNSNVLFDCLVPYEFTENEKKMLEESLCKIVKVIDDKYTCIINIEHGFL